MSDTAATEAKEFCLFCAIADGTIKTPGVFYDDGKYMAFLSIFPNTEGFTVVMPKVHYPSDCLHLPDGVLQEFILVAKSVAGRLETRFEDVGRVGLVMEGLGVNHAHIKLIPMHGTDFLKRGEWRQCLSDKADYFENYPGYLISSDGPPADHDQLANLAKRLKA